MVARGGHVGELVVGVTGVKAILEVVQGRLVAWIGQLTEGKVLLAGKKAHDRDQQRDGVTWRRWQRRGDRVVMGRDSGNDDRGGGASFGAVGCMMPGRGLWPGSRPVSDWSVPERGRRRGFDGVQIVVLSKESRPRQESSGVRCCRWRRPCNCD